MCIVPSAGDALKPLGCSVRGGGGPKRRTMGRWNGRGRPARSRTERSAGAARLTSDQEVSSHLRPNLHISETERCHLFCLSHSITVCVKSGRVEGTLSLWAPMCFVTVDLTHFNILPRSEENSPSSHLTENGKTCRNSITGAVQNKYKLILKKVERREVYLWLICLYALRKCLMIYIMLEKQYAF